MLICFVYRIFFFMPFRASDVIKHMFVDVTFDSINPEETDKASLVEFIFKRSKDAPCRNSWPEGPEILDIHI